MKIEINKIARLIGLREYMRYPCIPFSRSLLKIVPISVFLAAVTSVFECEAEAATAAKEQSYIFHECNTHSVIQQQQSYYQKYFHKPFYQASQLSGISDQFNLPLLNYKIEKILPHVAEISTQGMLIKNGFVYESSGSLGDSEIVRYSLDDLVSRSIINEKSSIELPNNVFAEGLTASKDVLYLATLKKEKIIILDLKTHEIIREIQIAGDVWGMVYYKNRLLVGRGDSVVDTIDPSTGSIVESSEVTSLNFPLYGVNEMEVVGKFIYANVWPTDCIAVINPNSFTVDAWIDLSPLDQKLKRQHWSQVANGIAYDTKAKRLLVSGKHWNSSFYLNVSTPVKLKSR